jgi:hypothetical protein
MNLTAELAQALGLPPYCTKAVLTLEPLELPKLWVECLVVDETGRPIVCNGAPPEGVAARIQKVGFMLRLEPFKAETLSSHAPST